MRINLEINVNDLDLTASGRYKSTFINSVDELSIHAVSVYPNPSTGLINIEASNISAVYLANQLGQMVKVKSTVLQNRALLSIENIPAGMYTLITEFKDGSIVARRVQKQ